MLVTLVVATLLSRPQDANFTQVDATAQPGGQAIMLLIPKSYDAKKSAPLIIYHHGVGEDQRALLADGLKRECVQALLDAGYILCGSNAHGNNWGTQAALDDYAELFSYARKHFKISRTCFWSQSMGGMSGLLSLQDRRIPDVQGWLGTYPVANQQTMYAKTPTFRTQIEAAFSFHGEEGFAAATKGHDPCLLNPKRIKCPRFRFYASSADTIVPQGDNTDVMFALLKPGRRECELVTCRGDHGDRSHFVPSEYVAFFDRCKRR